MPFVDFFYLHLSTAKTEFTLLFGFWPFIFFRRILFRDSIFCLLKKLSLYYIASRDYIAHRVHFLCQNIIQIVKAERERERERELQDRDIYKIGKICSTAFSLCKRHKKAGKPSAHFSGMSYFVTCNLCSFITIIQ